MRNHKVLSAFLLILLICSCKDPYYPKLKSAQTDYLVVEGFISAGNDGTQIQLSRAVPVNDSAKLKAERNANVSVEDADGTVYPLQEQGNGLYTAALLNLDPIKKYRLKIGTFNGSQYESEEIILKQAPPVDVNWTRENDGVHITFSSQDLQNNTHYYKWNFEETWEVISHYEARYKYENSLIIGRDTNEMKSMYHCWRWNKPSTIRVISTIPFTKDAIEKEPVVFIPAGDEKLDIRYSILVKLQALDKPSYEFYQMMKKNTESLGSIFDPQPTELNSNIHCINNPNEKVIGYVLGSTLEEKRIFISKDDVPNWNYNPACVTIEVPNNPQDLAEGFSQGDFIPYATKGSFIIIAYYGVESRCADCRINGGNNTKPPFWP